MNLQEFVEQFGDFYAASGRQQTDVLAYWLQHGRRLTSFAPSDLEQSFTALDVKPYSRIGQYLSEEAHKSRGGRYLRANGGYRLAREVQTTLDASISSNGRSYARSNARPDQVSQPFAYQWHPEIQKVSNKLFADGHFKQAVLEAFIRVINELKHRSGVQKDGDDLVNLALGAEKKSPVLRFNSMATDAERDEHRGIFYLFKGVVGIRNFKAHSNVLFDSPERAFEYLALASLLMRLLDVAIKDAATP